MMEAIPPLLERLWGAVAERPCSVSGVHVTPPEPVPADMGPPDGRYRSDYPALAHLDGALEEARTAGFEDIANGIAGLVGGLRWSQNNNYTEANCSRSLLDGYAYAALSGPDGPVVCAAPRGGLMLMGPNVTYPAHNHAPREIYLVLTPGVRWSLDNGEWFNVEAGALIVHEPWVWHALQTTDKPMLAFAGWVEPGDRSSIGFAR